MRKANVPNKDEKNFPSKAFKVGLMYIVYCTDKWVLEDIIPCKAAALPQIAMYNNHLTIHHLKYSKRWTFLVKMSTV